MNTKNKTITKINFGGFYKSNHSYNIEEYVEDRELELSDPEHKSLLIEYCKEYINIINYELNTNMQFKELVSPKYYNFSTDYINVEVSNKDLLLIKEFLKEESNYLDSDYKEDLKELIKENTTGRASYIPFYSYNDYFKKENKSLLFECYLDLLLRVKSIEILPYDIELNYQS